MDTDTRIEDPEDRDGSETPGAPDRRRRLRRNAAIGLAVALAVAGVSVLSVFIYSLFDDDGPGDGWFAYEGAFRPVGHPEDGRHGWFGDDGDGGIDFDAADGVRKGGGRHLDGERIDRLDPEPGVAKGDEALSGEGVSKGCGVVAQLPRHVVLVCPRDGFGGEDFGPWAHRRDRPFAPGFDGGPGTWSGEGGKALGVPDGKGNPRRFGGDRSGWWPDGWSGWGPKGSFGYGFDGGGGSAWADGWSGPGPKGSFGYGFDGGGGYRFDGDESFGGGIGPGEFPGDGWPPAPGPEWPVPSPWTCTFEWSDPSGGSGGAFGGDCLDLFGGFGGFGDFEGFEGFEGFDGFGGFEGLDGFGGFDGFEGFGSPGGSPFSGFGGDEEGLRVLMESLLESLDFDGSDPEGFEDLIEGELFEELFGDLLAALLEGVDLGGLTSEAPDVPPGDEPGDG